MFCTKCGKELHDGDRFCGYCGAEVREIKHSKYDDVVFNPPFRMEAQRRTEEILKSTENKQEQAKKETIAFDWNLDGFPSAKPRKTEDVDFNWDSVLERRNSSREIKVEKIEPEEEFFFSEPSVSERDTKEVPTVKDAIVKDVTAEHVPVRDVHSQEYQEEDEDALSIEELEKELFGEAAVSEETSEPAQGNNEKNHFDDVAEPTIVAAELLKAVKEPNLEDIIPEADSYRKEDERFYTYNQKYDAFQELLEKERERLRSLEESYNKNKESLDYTWVGEVFPELKKNFEKPEVKAPAVEEPAAEDAVAEAPTVEGPTTEKPEIPVTEGPAAEKPEIPVTETPAAEKPAAEEPATEEPATEGPEVVAVTAPPLTMVIDADAAPAKSADEQSEQQKKPEEKSEQKDGVGNQETAPSKTKLRYSDVFPRDFVEGSGVGSADSAETGQVGEKPQNDQEKKIEKPEQQEKPGQPEKPEQPGKADKDADDEKEKTIHNSLFDDLNEEEPKKHTFAKVVIGILIFLIAAEGIIIGVKFIAPESKLSLWADNMMIKVVDLVMGGGDDEDNQDGEENPDVNLENSEKEVYMSNLVAYGAKDIKTIGEAVYDPDLKFAQLSENSFEEIADAEDFADLNWYEDAEGNEVTYGQELMKALLKHYDSWQGTNDDKSLVGINKVAVGEIKTGEKGFYVLCRIVYAGADGEDVEKLQTVYVTVSDRTLIINEIKEDN